MVRIFLSQKKYNSLMSLKDPYLNTRGLSGEEAYKLISNCLDKHFAYKYKKEFPKYRCRQILNAITHSPLTAEQAKELRQRVRQLREARKQCTTMRVEVKHQKAARKKSKKNSIVALNNGLGGNGGNFLPSTSPKRREDLPHPQSARIIYHHNGPKK